MRLVDLIGNIRLETLLQTQIVQIETQTGFVWRQDNEFFMPQRGERQAFRLSQWVALRQHQRNILPCQQLTRQPRQYLLLCLAPDANIDMTLLQRSNLLAGCQFV
ncbi:hypothetical protein D3C80_1833090 [compost metagenome]